MDQRTHQAVHIPAPAVHKERKNWNEKKDLENRLVGAYIGSLQRVGATVLGQERCSSRSQLEQVYDEA